MGNLVGQSTVVIPMDNVYWRFVRFPMHPVLAQKMTPQELEATLLRIEMYFAPLRGRMSLTWLFFVGGLMLAAGFFMTVLGPTFGQVWLLGISIPLLAIGIFLFILSTRTQRLAERAYQMAERDLYMLNTWALTRDMVFKLKPSSGSNRHNTYSGGDASEPAYELHIWCQLSPEERENVGRTARVQPPMGMVGMPMVAPGMFPFPLDAISPAGPMMAGPQGQMMMGGQPQQQPMMMPQQQMMMNPQQQQQMMMNPQQQQQMMMNPQQQQQMMMMGGQQPMMNPQQMQMMMNQQQPQQQQQMVNPQMVQFGFQQQQPQQMPQPQQPQGQALPSYQEATQTSATTPTTAPTTNTTPAAPKSTAPKRPAPGPAPAPATAASSGHKAAATWKQKEQP